MRPRTPSLITLQSPLSAKSHTALCSNGQRVSGGPSVGDRDAVVPVRYQPPDHPQRVKAISASARHQIEDNQPDSYQDKEDQQVPDDLHADSNILTELRQQWYPD
jgi:hypothetical protein